MQIKLPNSQALAIKGIQGSNVPLVATLLMPRLAAFFGTSGVELLPGQESAVVVSFDGIPKNATFTRLTGKIKFWQSSPTNGFDVTGASIHPDARTISNKMDVAIKGQKDLRNAKLRLENGEVFWSQAGPIPLKDSGPTEFEILPDFSAAANRFLEQHPSTDQTRRLVFLVQADTPALVEVTIAAADYELVLLQTETWENELDDTFRFDRNLSLDYCAIESLPLEANRASDYPRLRSVTLDLVGQPALERLLGNIDPPDGREFAIVNSQFSVAQELRPGFSIRCAGLAAHLRAETEAELYFELRKDLPTAASAAPPLSSARIEVAASDEPGARWVFVSMQEEVRFERDQPYWIIVRAIRGAVQLAALSGAAPTPPIVPAPSGLVPETAGEQPNTQLLINRGGQQWKPFAGPSRYGTAWLRLIYLPDPDHQTAAVELALQFNQNTLGLPSPSQRIDLSDQPQFIRFDVSQQNLRPPPGENVRLLIKSHMRGEVTVANLIQEFAK